jgi:Protein of unknown function (DUF3237)
MDRSTDGQGAPIELTPIMRLWVDVRPPISAGATPHGEIRVLPFDSGTFETIPQDGSEPLRGTVADGGTDWQTVRADGGLEIRAHYMLATDDGDVVEVVSEGLRHAAPDVLERLAAGDDVDPSEYYFRTHVRFATGSERFDHLNRLLGVAVGQRHARGVHLTVYAVP